MPGAMSDARSDTTQSPPGTSGDARRPRVVVVGGGFAGLYAARGLAAAPVEVTLVDRVNHHLFQPLLYQVATGIIDEGSVAPALRGVLRDQANVEVLLAEVTGFDFDGPHRAGLRARRAAAHPGLRHPGRGHRRADRLLRPRRLVGGGARAQVARRRALAAQPHPRRLRDGRARHERRRTARLADLRRGRRRADRGRAHRRDRDPRAPRAAPRLSQRLDTRGTRGADGRRPHHPAALSAVTTPPGGERPRGAGRRDPRRHAGRRDRRRRRRRATQRRRDGRHRAAAGTHHHLGGRGACGGGSRRPGGGRRRRPRPHRPPRGGARPEPARPPRGLRHRRHGRRRRPARRGPGRHAARPLRGDE